MSTVAEVRLASTRPAVAAHFIPVSLLHFLKERDRGSGAAAAINCVDQLRASLMICSWVNSARPSSANSVPMPDCLAPPNGMCGAMSRCLLIHTVPASIWLATLWARAVSDDQTEAPRP